MFVATKYASPIVHEFVDRLNALVFTPVYKYPPTGAGTERRRRREAAKLKANKAIPSGQKMTRQRRRATERQLAKGRTEGF